MERLSLGSLRMYLLGQELNLTLFLVPPTPHPLYF